MKTNKIILSLMFIIGSVVLFSSCSEDNPTTVPIPKTVLKELPGKYMGATLINSNKGANVEATVTDNQMAFLLPDTAILNRIITDKALLEEAKKNIKSSALTTSWRLVNYAEGKTEGSGLLSMILIPMKAYSFAYTVKGKTVTVTANFSGAMAMYNASTKKLNISVGVKEVVIDKKKVDNFKAFTFKVVDAEKSKKV